MKGKRTIRSQSQKRSSVGSYSNARLYEHRAKAHGDTCASHRGTSPAGQRKPPTTSRYRVVSPSPSRKSPAVSPAMSRKSFASSLSNKSNNKKGSKPSATQANTEDCEEVLAFNPSVRTRKLYRFKNNFSDGASEESDLEGWFQGEDYQRTRKNGTRFGGPKRRSKLSMPLILVQDFSKQSPSGRDPKKMARLKMRVLSQFSSGRTGQTPLNITHAQNRNTTQIAKAKLRAVSLFSSRRDHHGRKSGRLLPRNKILAINSFRSRGKNSEDLSDVESDHHGSQEIIPDGRNGRKSGRQLPRNKIMALNSFRSRGKSREDLSYDESDHHGSQEIISDGRNERKSGRRLPRNKILAINSFRSRGKGFSDDFSEVESDHHGSQEIISEGRNGRQSGRLFPKNKIMAVTSFRSRGKNSEDVSYVESDLEHSVVDDISAEENVSQVDIQSRESSANIGKKAPEVIHNTHF